MSKQIKTSPTNITTLFNALSGDSTQVASRMGVHPSTINRALHDGLTTIKQEARARAALDALRKEQQDAEQPTQFFVEVPVEKIDGFKRVAQAMGIELVGL